MDYEVPFVPNTDDDLHCLQSVFLMILRYFRPELEMPWEEWSKITGYEEGKGTWASAGLLWFISQGFDVKHISMFDYERFGKEGGEYLIDASGREVGEWQVAHSNIPLEQTRANQLVEAGVVEKREPTIDDFKHFLDDGYLLHVLVNSRKLNDKDGYFGHAVVVKGYDDKHLIIHDPGPPALADRNVTYEDFEKAWADPNAEAKEMEAIRYIKK